MRRQVSVPHRVYPSACSIKLRNDNDVGTARILRHSLVVEKATKTSEGNDDCVSVEVIEYLEKHARHLNVNFV